MLISVNCVTDNYRNQEAIYISIKFFEYQKK